MPRLVIFFNELSAPPNMLGPAEAPQWSEWAKAVFSCLRAAQNHSGDTEIVILRGTWHALCGDRPLSVWLANWLGRLKYQWLLAKLRMIEAVPQFDVDIYMNADRSSGIAMAHNAQSWAVSFPVAGSAWLNHTISATRHELVGDNLVETQIQVRNLAQEHDAAHWEHELVEYGREIAPTNVISKHGDHLVVMYPHDHLPPHFHLVDAAHEPRTVAKFRFDMFERLEGPPKWDAHFKVWTAAHRDELLISWARCRRGGHPFLIEAPNV